MFAAPKVNKYNADFYGTAAISGALGAILTGLAVQFIAPLSLTLKSYISLLIVGLIAGFVFSYSIDSESIFINAIGFIVWQSLVCLTICFTKKS